MGSSLTPAAHARGPRLARRELALSLAQREICAATRHVGATCPPKIGSNDVHSANLAPALRLAPLAGELVGCWQHPSTGGS